MKKRLHITVECPESLTWDLEEGQERKDVEDGIKDYIRDLLYLWIREEEIKE